MVALDPFRGYATGLLEHLGHATVVLDHFHAVRLANTAIDDVRRRTQNETPGPSGTTGRPALRHPPAPARRTRAPGRAGLAAPPRRPRRGSLGRGRGRLLGQTGAPTCRVRRRRSRPRSATPRRLLRLVRSSRGPRAHPGWPTPSPPGRTRCSPTTPQGLSNGPTEAVNLLIEKVRHIGTASATSTTIACGSFFAAAWHGHSSRRSNQRPSTTLGRVEPLRPATTGWGVPARCRSGKRCPSPRPTPGAAGRNEVRCASHLER